jgi:predicted permease
MWRDIRYAVQGLWKSPAFTVSATLALGLAIGANAAIFGLLDGLWFRPPGIANAGRLVRVFSTTATEREGLWSYPEYLALRDEATSFDGVVAQGRRGATMAAADGTPELLYANVVSTNFFTTLGINAAAGRLFGPGDEAALESQPGVVLGHSFWLRRFGGDPSIVGRTIRLMRREPLTVTVLGVLPASFRDIEAAGDRDLWMPPPTWVRLTNRGEFERREERWFDVFAVRTRGTGVRTADTDVARIASNLAAAFPVTNTGRSGRAADDFDHRVERGGVNAKALLGLVLLVVLITCVNVANLLLARGAARTREIAVRVALGAGRARLLRQLMTESLLLGLLGAIAGFTFALWLIRLMPALVGVPPGARSFTVFQVDARVLLFTFIVTILTTCLFGIVPSWLAATADVAPLIKGGAGGGDPRVDRRVRQALVISQIAISVVLLCGAAVMTRSFIETRRADVGVTRKPLLSAWISGQEFTRASVREALDRVARTPGVVRASIAIRAPLSLSGGGRALPLYFPDRPPAPGEGLPEVKLNAVSADYFATTGTRLLAGRVFIRDDEVPGEPVIVVSEQFERRFFPGASAIGARVQPGGAKAPVHRVIGVVQDAVINDIDEPAEPYCYVPYFRGDYGEVTFLVQTAGDAGAFTSTLKQTLKDVDPRLDPRRVVTMRDYMEYSASRFRATAALAAALGLVGLILTVLGIYGVISYRTARRTREIGIRMALGARRQDVVRLIVSEGAVVGATGVMIGIAAALLVTKSMASMLFRVTAWDPVSFTLAAIVVFGLACLATAVPAMRATRVAPSTALRDA